MFDLSSVSSKTESSVPVKKFLASLLIGKKFTR